MELFGFLNKSCVCFPIHFRMENLTLNSISAVKKYGKQILSAGK